MESTATIAEWQKPRLQQMKISPNATVVDTKTNKKKKKNYLPSEGLKYTEISNKKHPHLSPANP